MAYTVGMKHIKRQRWLSVGLLTLGGIGLLASIVLTVETVKVMQDPGYAPSCSVNPIFNCASVMKSDQAAVFGIPNPVFGMLGFGALMAMSILLLVDVRLYRWMWYCALAVAAIGVVFVHYLIFESLFVLRTICPWCFVVWLTVMGIAWTTVRYVVEARYITNAKWVKYVKQYSLLTLAVWCVCLLVLILWQFRDSWGMIW